MEEEAVLEVLVVASSACAVVPVDPWASVGLAGGTSSTHAAAMPTMRTASGRVEVIVGTMAAVNHVCAGSSRSLALALVRSTKALARARAGRFGLRRPSVRAP